MTLALIIFRSLRQHLLSTVITALSIALAGGLLMSVWTVKQQSQQTFTQVNIGFDAVLGARGSKLQLVLNSIFHLEASQGNISQADYDYVRRLPVVKLAIPIAVGDNLRGFRSFSPRPNMRRAGSFR
jgi:putative ABC transport system permease protein